MGEILKNIIYLARRFKLPTLLNLLGLVLAFATFYLLMTQVIYQATYNHGIENYQHLYRMESSNVFNEWQYTNNIAQPFANALDSMPRVESYSLILNTHIEGYEDLYNYTFLKGVLKKKWEYTLGNNTAVSALTSKALCGRIEWTDSDQNVVIIPASFALDYFGTTQAADSLINGKYSGEPFTMKVLGVYQDFPKNSELSNRIYSRLDTSYMYVIDNSIFNCIVKFKSFPSNDNELNAFTDSLKNVVIKSMSEGLKQQKREEDIPKTIQAIKKTEFRFTPLARSYFEHSSYTTGESGFQSLFLILLFSCMLLMVMATINYFNFTLAQSPMRISSLNTRRVLGAYRRHLRWGVVMECVFTSVAACLLALVLCRFLKMLPVTAKLASGSMGLIGHWPLVLLMLVLAVGVGFVAGVYPAVFATSYAPAFALKSRFGLTPLGKRLRTLLLGLQLTVSMMMIIYFGILYLQSRYIFNSPYGYDTEQILLTKLPFNMELELDTIVAQREKLYHDVINIPGVEKVSFSINGLGTTDGHATINTDQNTIFSYLHTSSDYLRTMGIKIIEGRDFVESDSCVAVINKAASKEWDWIKIGSKIPTDIDVTIADSATVVGICNDLRYGTTRISNDKPFCFILDKNNAVFDDFDYNRMNVRLAADCDGKAVRQQINDLAKKCYKTEDIETVFFNKTFESTYKDEFRFINLILIISAISLIITIIGVVCMTLFETEYRRKEIGIRKVAGATTGEIIQMFCRQYTGILAISFAISVPLSYLIGKLTLKYFAEYVDIPWWIYPVSLLLVGCVTLGIVLFQSWRIARENPVNSIKAE